MKSSSTSSTTEEYSPPYGSKIWYDRFFKLLKRIKIGRVDTKFLKTNEIASGNEYKVVQGLKFLDMIDDNGNAKDRMRKLSVVGPDFTQNLEKTVRDAYSILFSKVKLEEAEPINVINCFKVDYDMAPTTAKEAAGIFVFLAQKAKIPMSETITDKLGAKPKKRKGKRKKKRKKSEPETGEKIPTAPEGMDEIKWKDDILIYIRRSDQKTREIIARTAKKLIDMYVEEEEAETK